MNTILWIAQLLLAIAFLYFGFMHLMKSKDELKAKGGERMNWLDELGERQVKLIGLLEVLGAFGLFLPDITGVLPFLAAWAAMGLLLTMVFATIFHFLGGRREPRRITVILGLVALFVSYGRFFIAPLS